ncbi:MAG: DNA-processing protein DprA [Burkholderiaceae bacterium]|nr:DNA-processing protein DprA [Burkholderiaceae bacterium]MCD8515815.1 DNA-processing protein DprA [Burkholderiaceae bacterium]MCD8536185.1 DNA-processing protein DprA [Burkholderiaceae bacterium]MCD8564149.1 DNA-processing protein DprA [Burkholderiaceae bacterium]
MTNQDFTSYQQSVLQQHLSGGARRSGDSPAMAQVFRWLSEPSAHCITIAHQQYPGVLRTLIDPPPVLYGLGDWQLFDKPAVAIVGARRCTPRAAAHAWGLAREIARQGWCVVSGLARGIDTAAHKGALASGVAASTIAVLGSGVDVTYPPENAALANQIVGSGGLLISEFRLGSPPLAKHFPQRNRIVAALGRATIVVQARIRSGSMITARLAGEMGREVLAVPGAPGDPLAEGPHELIRQGAALLENVDDLWSVFGLCAQMSPTNATH